MNILSSKYYLLLLLAKQNDYISIETLTEELSCSASTILRHLKDIRIKILEPNKINITGSRTEGFKLVGNLEAIDKIIAKLKTHNGLSKWHNKQERCLLIIIELLKSKDNMSKFSSLGSVVGVSEATILKDIRFINERIAPIFIQSKPGAGTILIGSSKLIQAKIMNFIYEVLSPTNLLLFSTNYNLNINYESSSASEILLEGINGIVNTEDIVDQIQIWEEATKISLSDIAFVNLFLYLIIFQLRTYHQPNRMQEQAKLFLNSNILLEQVETTEQQNMQEFLAALNVQVFEKYILADTFIDEDIQEIIEILAEHIKQLTNIRRKKLLTYLLLLRYRSKQVFSYWQSSIKKNYKGRFKANLALIDALSDICQQKSYKDWLKLDSVLFFLDSIIPNDVSNQIDVTIFCLTGIATVQLMQRQIEKFCPHLNILNTYSLRDYHAMSLDSDIIISNVRSKILPKHAIIIDSILNEESWLEIEQTILLRQQRSPNESIKNYY